MDTIRNHRRVSKGIKIARRTAGLGDPVFRERTPG